MTAQKKGDRMSDPRENREQNDEIRIVRLCGRADLSGFDRRQDVKRIWTRQDGAYVLIDQPYQMDWDARRKQEVAEELENGNCIAHAAMCGDRIAGFVSVLREVCDGRMILDIIQVDRAFRGRGLGRKLWNTAVQEAKKAGAQELYISAFCAEETVTFYKAMGARITQRPIAKIAQAEPCDIQMEYIIEQ